MPLPSPARASPRPPTEPVATSLQASCIHLVDEGPGRRRTSQGPVDQRLSSLGVTEREARVGGSDKEHHVVDPRRRFFWCQPRLEPRQRGGGIAGAQVQLGTSGLEVAGECECLQVGGHGRLVVARGAPRPRRPARRAIPRGRPEGSRRRGLATLPGQARHSAQDGSAPGPNRRCRSTSVRDSRHAATRGQRSRHAGLSPDREFPVPAHGRIRRAS